MNIKKIINFLYNILDDVLSLMLPRACPVCSEILLEGENFLCTACRFRIPLTGFIEQRDNAMAQRMWGLVPISHAAALFWFQEGSAWRGAIHKIKYKSAWYLAYKFGRFMGNEMKRAGTFDDVDIVVAVPLHWFKRLRRGYNQSEYLALGIAKILGVKCNFRAVKRCRNNRSQTQQRRSERWDNVQNIFAVRNPKALRGHHVLIVDDVFTTGATIIACADTIYRACGGDVRISIVTLAASHYELGQI